MIISAKYSPAHRFYWSPAALTWPHKKKYAVLDTRTWVANVLLAEVYLLPLLISTIAISGIFYDVRRWLMLLDNVGFGLLV